MEIVHDNIITFSGIAQQLDNYYNMDDFLYGCLIFIYNSDGERDGDKKEIFFRIRHNWGPLGQGE